MLRQANLISPALIFSISVLITTTATADQHWVDNVDNCIWAQELNDCINGLNDIWPQVNLAGGEWTVSLVDSDFGRSPAEENHLAVVFMPYNNDQPGIDGPWFFTLNGVGNHVTFMVSETPGRGRAWLGFFDIDPSDNHGSSTVEFACAQYSIFVTIDGVVNCFAVDYPDVFIPLTNLEPGTYTTELAGDVPRDQCWIMCEGIAPEYSDYCMFSLMNIQDQDNVLEVLTFEMMSGATIYLGKIDNWVADNWGGSWVSIEYEPVAVEAATWSEVKAQYR